MVSGHRPGRGFAGGYIIETLGLDPWNVSNAVGGWGLENTVFAENYTNLAGIFITGEDPNDGVTNRWGQAHNIDNLFVSDGSTFSTSAAANPTLTIVALVIRQADHIAERMTQKTL